MHLIADNFLDKEYFTRLKEIVLSSQFPWFYQSKVNVLHSKEDLELYFTHIVYNENKITGGFYNELEPLIKKLKANKIIRVKVNLYPRTSKLITHIPHKDYDYEHKGAILYLNTNNGYTILDDDTKIESIENRMLFFNSNKLHSSTSCTDVKVRVNININYI